MSDDTTTDKPVEEQPQEDGQAEESIEQSAESLRTGEDDKKSEQEPETQEQEPETEESAEDNSEEPEANELLDWAKKKGIDPSNTEAILKSYREAEKKLHQTGMEASALKKQATEGVSPSSTDAVIQEARILNFYNANPDARNYDAQMGEIYGRFKKTDPDFAEHLIVHPDTLYAMAKTESGQQEVQQARQQGKVEATQAIKKAQTASTPKMNATSSAPPKTGWDEAKVNKVIAEGNYDKYREEILNWERSQY